MTKAKTKTRKSATIKRRYATYYYASDSDTFGSGKASQGAATTDLNAALAAGGRVVIGQYAKACIVDRLNPKEPIFWVAPKGRRSLDQFIQGVNGAFPGFSPEALAKKGIVK